MLQKSKAIVLNSLKYGESGMIIHCFTRDYGLKSYFIKGIFSSKKSKFKRSYFQPLNQLEIVGYHNTRGQLNSIKDVSFLDHYQEIHTEITKQSMTLFLSEILTSTLTEESVDEKLFDFLSYSFLRLDKEEKIANFHLSFLVQLIQHLGFYPIIDEELAYFDLVESKFSNTIPNNKFITKPLLANFIKVLKSDYDQILKLKLVLAERNEILENLFTYMSLHLHSFKKPKSIIVFQELFH